MSVGTSAWQQRHYIGQGAASDARATASILSDARDADLARLRAADKNGEVLTVRVASLEAELKQLEVCWG